MKKSRIQYSKTKSPVFSPPVHLWYNWGIHVSSVEKRPPTLPPPVEILLIKPLFSGSKFPQSFCSLKEIRSHPVNDSFYESTVTVPMKTVITRSCSWWGIVVSWITSEEELSGNCKKIVVCTFIFRKKNQRKYTFLNQSISFFSGLPKPKLL